MGFKNEEYLQVVYYAHAGDGGGSSLEDALPLTDGTAFQLPAGVVVKSVDVVVLTALAGTTAVVWGDAGDADGLVDADDVTEATPGVYAGAGAYLAGAGKYYADATNVLLDATGASSAGALALVVRGYQI